MINTFSWKTLRSSPVCLFYVLFSFDQGSILITVATLFYPWPSSKTSWLLCRQTTRRPSHWPTQTLSTSMPLFILLTCYCSSSINVQFNLFLFFCRDFSVSCSGDIFINRENPMWYYYFLCGVKGIQVGNYFHFTEFWNKCCSVFMVTLLLCFAQEKFGNAHLAGMSCMVDGTIPPSSGLSSSSALVCCAGLVTMEANGKSLSKVWGPIKKRSMFIV